MDVFSVVEDEFPASIGVHPGSVLHCGQDELEPILLALPDPVYVSGGAAANTMKIGALLGLDTGFCGSLGKDGFGEMFSKEMEGAGVGLSGLKFVREKTGCAVVMLSRSGRYSLVVSPSAALELDGPDIDDALIATADWIYVDGFLLDRRQLFLSLLNRAMLAKKKIAVDLGSWMAVRDNHALALEIATHYADLVFCNEEELEALAGMSTQEALGLFRLPRAAIVLKRGPAGSIYMSGKESFACSAPMANLLDSTGAGDAFAAGYLSALAAGQPPSACLSRGSEVAALSLGVFGSAMNAEDIGKLRR
jgi:sugar/nucleoside kinase (ribokinase family)